MSWRDPLGRADEAEARNFRIQFQAGALWRLERRGCERPPEPPERRQTLDEMIAEVMSSSRAGATRP